MVNEPRHMTLEVLQRGMIDSFEEFYNFTHVLNEALNEATYTVEETFRRLLLFGARPIQHSTLMKGAGIFIVKKWKRLNAHYFDYLRQVRTPGFDKF